MKNYKKLLLGLIIGFQLNIHTAANLSQDIDSQILQAATDGQPDRIKSIVQQIGTSGILKKLDPYITSHTIAQKKFRDFLRAFDYPISKEKLTDVAIKEFINIPKEIPAMVEEGVDKDLILSDIKSSYNIDDLLAQKDFRNALRALGVPITKEKLTSLAIKEFINIPKEIPAMVEEGVDKDLILSHIKSSYNIDNLLVQKHMRDALRALGIPINKENLNHLLLQSLTFQIKEVPDLVAEGASIQIPAELFLKNLQWLNIKEKREIYEKLIKKINTENIEQILKETDGHLITDLFEKRNFRQFLKNELKRRKKVIEDRQVAQAKIIKASNVLPAVLENIVSEYSQPVYEEIPAEERESDVLDTAFYDLYGSEEDFDFK